MQNKLLPYYIMLILTISAPAIMQAKDDDNGNKNQQRISITLEYEPIKNLSFSLSPELRYNSDWTLKKYLLELGGEYDILKWFSVEGTYYAGINKRKKKGNEFQSKYKIGPSFDKKFNNFKTGVKLFYSNFSDEDTNDNFFRFGYSAKYNIKKFNLTPEVGLDYYYSLTESTGYKLRYAAGFSYKLMKHNSISFTYKLDDFSEDKQNRNIYELNYKLKF